MKRGSGLLVRCIHGAISDERKIDNFVGGNE